ncbi:hypothetical protein [Caviibacter abscessus]|uniref:hypothetical protein n=1 Tax=Caviibacter abscessus TaxID=1766719 RepID=UPI000838FF0B|nr:hypothetical protein [Caviibacter abscessus]
MKINNINELQNLKNKLLLYKAKIFYKVLYTYIICGRDNDLYYVPIQVMPDLHIRNYIFTKEELNLFFEDIEIFKGE